jgi:hypothetical protein
MRLKRSYRTGLHEQGEEMKTSWFVSNRVVSFLIGVAAVLVLPRCAVALDADRLAKQTQNPVAESSSMLRN